MGKTIQATEVPQPHLSITECPAIDSWRLIFDARKKVVAIFRSDVPMKVVGNSLFVSDPITETFTSAQGFKECLDKIVELGLSLEIVSPQVKAQIDKVAQEKQLKSMEAAKNRKLALMR